MLPSLLNSSIRNEIKSSRSSFSSKPPTHNNSEEMNKFWSPPRNIIVNTFPKIFHNDDLSFVLLSATALDGETRRGGEKKNWMQINRVAMWKQGEKKLPPSLELSRKWLRLCLWYLSAPLTSHFTSRYKHLKGKHLNRIAFVENRKRIIKLSKVDK